MAPHRASSIRGAGEHGVPTGVDDLAPIDLLTDDKREAVPLLATLLRDR